ncbi:cupin domain-containing protein [Streptomyces diastatochromogenes]|uniref:cupin domain-containing protein n=1 Tax=Streptomyces diastatochromogenes TaxID=42236 RepID=UPI000B917315|nr:DUF4437 domain-containing protein [Streptomyces diastatochromogenes]MCZ0985437.1 cupin domain-containing protein [Streptomyces diastatochromogenes]
MPQYRPGGKGCAAAQCPRCRALSRWRSVPGHTGMEVLKVVYRAGFTNPWHTHNCAHGIYVLDGTLTTHQGDYPAGSFVWFPEGGTMTHGAGDDGDCTFLFITNKPFDIQYVAE